MALAKSVTLAFLSLMLVVAIIIQPDSALQSSLQGLTVWWNIVFPGLLPFLVLFEIISAFGLAHAIGALLQPLMTRIFKMPGEAAVAIVLGWMGGSPAGAEATASLRRRNLVTQQQGQRLLALAHMPNPLFILVIIGAGFLKQPILGPIIAAAVWLSALWLMLVTALLNPNSRGVIASDLAEERQLSAMERAAHAMQLGREQDGRSFGKVLGDAVSVSVQKLMVIGGFMIFASVVAKLSEPLLTPLLSTFGLSFIAPALFESHLGAYASAVWDAPGVSLLPNAAVIAAVLAWGGLSGILQAGYAISGTDIRLLPFIGLRCVHALHAFAFMLLLWKPIHYLLGLWSASGTAPAIVLSGQFTKDAETTAMTAIIRAGDLPALWPYSAAACAALSLMLLLVATVLRLVKQAPRPFIK